MRPILRFLRLTVKLARRREVWYNCFVSDVGVEPEQVTDVIHLIERNCNPPEEPRPVKEDIPMYAATIFVLEAKQFMRV